MQTMTELGVKISLEKKVMYKAICFLFLAVTLIIALPSSISAQSESAEVLLLIHGVGDDVIQLSELSGLLAARIHGNPTSRHFAVETYDKSGNLVSLLVNTTDPYMGIVPFNFDSYDMQDISGGLIEVKAEGEWSIEIIALESLVAAQTNQVVGGYGDYVGYVKGSALVASVYGNEELRHFAVSAIGVNGNKTSSDLLVNTTSFYQGNVRLPANKDGLVLIVTAVGEWGISFNTSDPKNVFDTSIATVKSNPYSPFKDVLEKPTATPTTIATATKAALPTATGSVNATTGIVNRDANLRSGPGTGFKIVGSAKNGQTVPIIGKNADGSWLQIDTNTWIAAFLVNQGQSNAQPVATAQPTKVSTLATPAAITTAATPTATPTAAPVVNQAPKVPYWGDTGVQTCGNFEWRVANVRRAKDAWYYDRKQTAQGEYLIVYVEVKNISGGTASFWDATPTMPGKDIAERASQYAAWMMTGGFNTLWKDDVAPGEFITLVGAFDVAPDTHTYLFGALSCEQIVAIGSWFELERGPIKASN